MTIEELFRRILRAHWVVVLLGTLLPVTAVVAYRLAQPAEYEGRVRVQVIADAPMSTTQVDALSARVLALATTPQLLREAMAETGVEGDVIKLSEEDVTTRGLGESPVVELSVVLGSRSDAGRLVSALADKVTEFMNEGARKRFRETDARINEQIDAAVAQREKLIRKLAAAPPDDRQAWQLRIEAVNSTMERLNSTRNELTVQDANRTMVVVIDGAHPEVIQVPSPLLPQAALGLLLGLLLGTGTAVALETVRPRLAGPRAVARHWDSPVLGRQDTPADELASTLAMVARRQGLETVVLLGVDGIGQRAAHTLLAELNDKGSLSAKSKSKRVPVGRGADGLDYDRTNRFRVTDLSGVTPAEERTAGVVLVVPSAPLQRDVQQADDLVRTMSWPVVGVVASAKGDRGKAEK